MDKPVLVEVHHAKKIVNNLNMLEGIVKIILVSQPIQEQMLQHITEIKDIIKNAKLQNNEI